jgi:hypothetical protein
VPKGVFKDIADIMEGATVPGAKGKRKGMAKAAEENGRYEAELRSPSEITKRIRRWKRRCTSWHAIWFEAAAQMRDEMPSCANAWSRRLRPTPPGALPSVRRPGLGAQAAWHFLVSNTASMLTPSAIPTGETHRCRP